MIALGGMEESSAVPLLSEALQDPDMRMRQEAAISIARIFQAPNARAYVNETVPLLLEHMRDHPEVREAVVQALSRSGSVAAVRPVIQAIGDPDSRVRMEAASGLALLAKDRGDASTRDAALKALIQALNDSDPYVVVWTAQALRSFGQAASAALPSLRRALQQLNGDEAGAVKATIELIEAKQ